MYKKIIGQKLRAVRQKAGWTQETVAKKAGVDTSLIGKIESGSHYASLKTLEQISKIFGMDLDYFLKLPEDDLISRLVVLPQEILEAGGDPLKAGIIRELSGLPEDDLRFVQDFIRQVKTYQKKKPPAVVYGKASRGKSLKVAKKKKSQKPYGKKNR